MTRTAIIAGRGALPAALAAALVAAGEHPLIAALDGFAPDGVVPDLTFRLERLLPMLRHLADRGVTRVTLAGGIARPRLDPALFDPDTAQIVPGLLAAMQGGDDAALRAVIAVIEDAGLAVVGVAEIAPGMIPGPCVLSGQIPYGCTTDALRGTYIVSALGAVDVGQGAVVQQGLCLAVEALPGTDAMLATVAAMDPALRPAPRGGILYKAPKPGQDLRIDLPAIGPATVAAAAAARLDGIVWQAGGTVLIDRQATVQAAEKAGLFLWSRAP